MPDVSTEQILRLVCEHTGQRVSLDLVQLDQYIAFARGAIALASRPAEVDDEALGLLRTILAGDVGQQTLGKLARGQSTETEDGKAWLAAHKLITAPSHTTNKEK